MQIKCKSAILIVLVSYSCCKAVVSCVQDEELSDELYDEIETALAKALPDEQFETIFGLATWNDDNSGVDRLRDWKTFDAAAVRTLKDIFEPEAFEGAVSRKDKLARFVRFYDEHLLQPCAKLRTVYDRYTHHFEHAWFAAYELHKVKDIVRTCGELAVESKRDAIGATFLDQVLK